MAAAIVGDLQNGPDSPENADAASQPAIDGLLSRNHLWSKAPGECGKDQHRGGNKPSVNVKNLAHQEGHLCDFCFPMHDAHELQIQEGEAELATSGHEKQDFECMFHK